LTAMAEPSADAMYRACADVLTSAAQIGGGWRAPTATALRNDMVALLREFVSRSREAGIADDEIAEARYALVAFIDDRVLKESSWGGREEWMSNPLQLQLFREYAAGENFFRRMKALAQRGRPYLALEAYYLCLALGFVGAAGAGAAGTTPRAYADSVRGHLLLEGSASRIAPNAIPVERHRPQRRPFPVALSTAVACVFVCLLGLVGLQLSLGTVIERAVRELANSASAASARQNSSTPPSPGR
jgi:type IV/VI secretion system ImpK/VasF family protein